MATWAEFADAAPDLSAAGWDALNKDGDLKGLLATVRDGQPPRIHPVSVSVVDGVLYTVVLPSAKLTDLLSDRRYALHAHLDPDRPVEFLVRGSARLIEDDAVRRSVFASWAFTPDETDRLFALDIDSALLGARDSAHDWPPRYSRWMAPTS